MKFCPPEEAQQFERSTLIPSSIMSWNMELGRLEFYISEKVEISLRLDSCESSFLINSLLEHVALYRVNFRFGVEACIMSLR